MGCFCPLAPPQQLIRRVSTELGWQLGHSIEDALAATVAWSSRAGGVARWWLVALSLVRFRSRFGLQLWPRARESHTLATCSTCR